MPHQSRPQPLRAANSTHSTTLYYIRARVRPRRVCVPARRACACVPRPAEYTTVYHSIIPPHANKPNPCQACPIQPPACLPGSTQRHACTINSTPQQQRGGSVPGSALFRRKQTAKAPTAPHCTTTASRSSPGVSRERTPKVRILASYDGNLAK